IRSELFRYIIRGNQNGENIGVDIKEILADDVDMYTVLQKLAEKNLGLNETLKILNRYAKNPDGSINQEVLNLGLILIDFDENAVRTDAYDGPTVFLYSKAYSHFYSVLECCKNADGTFDTKKMNFVNLYIEKGLTEWKDRDCMRSIEDILNNFSNDINYGDLIDKFTEYGISKETITTMLAKDSNTLLTFFDTVKTLYESEGFSNQNINRFINVLLRCTDDYQDILVRQCKDAELQKWFNRFYGSDAKADRVKMKNELIQELSSDDISPEKMQELKEKFIILTQILESHNDSPEYKQLVPEIYNTDSPQKLIAGVKSIAPTANAQSIDIILMSIQKDNFDVFQDVFEFLKHKSIDYSICKNIAKNCDETNAQTIKDVFTLLEEEYNIASGDYYNKKPVLPEEVWINLKDGNPENYKTTLELCKMLKGDARISQDFKTMLLASSHKDFNLVKELYTSFKAGSIDIKTFQDFVKFNTDYKAYDLQHDILITSKDGKTYQEISKKKNKKAIDKSFEMPLPESYNPENAAELDSRNQQRAINTSEEKGVPLVGLDVVKKPYKLLNLPSNEELIAALDRGEPVVIDIPNDGGMKPVKGNTSIAQDDIPTLGVVESAEVDLIYAIKRNWSNRKIARDLFQNFCDGHGGTLEGVQLSIQKVDGKYKIRVSGKGTYSYDYLKYMGATLKSMSTDNAGKYGEGSKIVAASLLAKETTDYVKYACGDWTFEFNRSSDDVQTAEMTRKLTKNDTPVEGNYIEFTTTDTDIVNSMIEAKDYFSHPYNKDFQNADYENEFFAIKILSPKEKGNIYMVQRYEHDGKFENSLDGFSLVFKVKSEDSLLSSKSYESWVLPSDRDRSGLPLDDIENMFKKYAKTMPDDDLIKLIATLEPIWSDGRNRNYLGKSITNILAEIAEERNLKIDFASKKYVYAVDPLDKEFAKTMGYIPIDIESFTKVGLDNLQGIAKRKIAMTPTEIQAAKIKLLNEGARIIASTLTSDDWTKMSNDEVDAPKFVFEEGGYKNEGGEAIIGWGTYEGHWVKAGMLNMNGLNCKFADILPVWLHEMTHKYGGDDSVEFTEALKHLEEHIIKVLIGNPDALAKFQYLAKKYDELDSVYSKEETLGTDFNTEDYKKQIINEVSSLKKYEGYVNGVKYEELAEPTRLVPEYKKPQPDKSKIYPEPLPTEKQLMDKLEAMGQVELSVPDLGGMKPTEDPAIIHEEDIPILGKPQKTVNTILYGQQLNWDQFKVARDIMQNFYDGSGHTMEGVTLKIQKDGNKYKVRIEGKSKYDYTYLQNTGRSTKGYLVYDIGGFGEGAKMTALSLLAQGSEHVIYGSGDWTTDFHVAETRIDDHKTDIMARTLSKAKEHYDGSFMEFETTDAQLVEQLLASKDFFVQPYNPTVQNLTFENKYFGYKLEKGIPQKVMLGQQFDISDDLKRYGHDTSPRLQLSFKLLPNNPEILEISGEDELKLTSTGVDRGNLSGWDVYQLCSRYVKTMSDADIIETIAALECFWISDFARASGNRSDTTLEYTFLKAVAREAGSRWGSCNLFKDKKLVFMYADSPEDREKVLWLKDQGYKFVDSEFRNFVKDGEEEYDKQHSLYSIKPTEAETRKLEIIRKAVMEIGQNNAQGLKLNLSDIPIYVYNSEVTNNPPIYAKIT
ncbi:MAG: hypothetical protein MJ231_05620, partial [bacterium]|nr:hypothetical protein [bacterium]